MMHALETLSRLAASINPDAGVMDRPNPKPRVKTCRLRDLTLGMPPCGNCWLTAKREQVRKPCRLRADVK